MLIRTLNQTDCLAVLREERLCVLSLVDGGEPYAVPVYYGFDGVSLFLGLSEGRKVRALERNPQVCVTVTSVRENGDWRSVQVVGEAVFVTNADERRRAIDVLIAHNRRLGRGTTQAAAEAPTASLVPGRIVSIEAVNVTGRARGI